VRAARAAAWLAKQVEIALSSVDLTGPQYRVLMLLGSGTASATDAAERLAVSPPSVTAVIDGLVARQLVTRGHGTDDRRRIRPPRHAP
jgi:long-chain acyl-CoA synthetase